MSESSRVHAPKRYLEGKVREFQIGVKCSKVVLFQTHGHLEDGFAWLKGSGGPKRQVVAVEPGD